MVQGLADLCRKGTRMGSAGGEREADLDRKSSLSQRHKRVQDTTTLSSQWMQLISGFHLGHLTDYDFSSLLELLLLQLKQPVEVTNTFFLRCYPFFQTIFQLFRWCYYYLDRHFLRVSQDVSGTQLHFRDAGCTSQEHFWSPGSHLPGWLVISLSEFWQTSVEYFFSLNQVTSCLLFDFISSHAVFIGNLYSW